MGPIAKRPHSLVYKCFLSQFLFYSFCLSCSFLFISHTSLLVSLPVNCIWLPRSPSVENVNSLEFRFCISFLSGHLQIPFELSAQLLGLHIVKYGAKLCPTTFNSNDIWESFCMKTISVSVCNHS